MYLRARREGTVAAAETEGPRPDNLIPKAADTKKLKIKDQLTKSFTFDIAYVMKIMTDIHGFNVN